MNSPVLKNFIQWVQNGFAAYFGYTLAQFVYTLILNQIQK